MGPRARDDLLRGQKALSNGSQLLNVGGSETQIIRIKVGNVAATADHAYRQHLVLDGRIVGDPRQGHCLDQALLAFQTL